MMREEKHLSGPLKWHYWTLKSGQGPSVLADHVTMSFKLHVLVTFSQQTRTHKLYQSKTEA